MSRLAREDEIMQGLLKEKQKLYKEEEEAYDSDNMVAIDIIVQKFKDLQSLINARREVLRIEEERLDKENDKKIEELAAMKEKEKIEEIKKKKIEAKKKEARESQEKFEKTLEEARMSRSYSDVFLSNNVPEQKMTLAMKIKLAQISAWQDRQRVTLEKIVEKGKSLSQGEKQVAKDIKKRLKGFGSDYSLSNLKEAIMDLQPDEEDDDYVRGQNDESDDDMPKAFADESGLMGSEYSFESPYDYIARLKVKFAHGNESALRQLNVSIRQTEALHTVIATKIALVDEKYKEFKKEHRENISQLRSLLFAKDTALEEMTVTLNRIAEQKHLQQAQIEKGELAIKTKEEVEVKLKEALGTIKEMESVGATSMSKLAIKRLEKQIDELKEQLKQAKSSVKMVTVVQKEVEVDLTEITNLKKNLEKEIKLREVKEKTIQRLTAEHEEKVAVLQRQIDGRERALLELADEDAQNQKKMQKLEEEAKKTREKIKRDYEEQIETLKRQILDTEDEMAELRQNDSELKAKIQEQEEEIRGVMEAAAEEADEQNKKYFEYLGTSRRLRDELIVKHDEEIATVRREVTAPLIEMIQELTKNTVAVKTKMYEYEAQNMNLKSDMERLKKKWDKVVENVKEISFKEGYNSAKIKNIVDNGTQTDTEGIEDEVVVQDYTVDDLVGLEMELMIRDYKEYKRKFAQKVVEEERKYDGTNFIDDQPLSFEKFFDRERKPKLRTVKWSAERFYDRYVKFGEKNHYSGPIAALKLNVDAAWRVMHKYDQLVSSLSVQRLTEREKRCEEIEALSHSELVAAMQHTYESRDPIKNPGNSDESAKIFNDLLKEIDEWPSNVFDEQQGKFFSYDLKQWEIVYEATFIGFKRKFYKVNIRSLNLHQSKVMFKLIVNLNLLTGSKSHIWYGNHLNREFNKLDFKEKGGAYNKKNRGYLLKRAQGTFFDWYGADAEIAFDELTKKLNTEAAKGYSILLKTIGSTFLARDLGVFVRCE
jgi:hypothetical protein